LKPDDWDKVVQTNLSGAFYMSKPAISYMIGRGSGRIINISSVSGEIGNIGQANYTAAKAGMFGLTKTLAKEACIALRVAGKLEKGIGVTVNCITPGLIDTDMLATVPPYLLAEIVERVPMHRMGQPEEIARVVSFLANDAAGYITGQVWGVNGGLDM
jgi:acetoacetyl-CoA reductase/3-oxoacyl-[acyl-carrier protein] reductase